MPCAATILRWLGDNMEFRDLYARVRELQTEAMAHEILEIADDVSGDVQRDRTRIDARKWLMSKLLPKKYGERAEIEHSGHVTLAELVLASQAVELEPPPV